MQTIDVHDLPDAVARAIAETAQALREQLKKNGDSPPPRLPTWPLGCTGRLDRDEIYGGYLDRKLDSPHPS